MTKNEKFLQNWEETRKRGRTRYALTEGVVFGMLLFLIPMLAGIFSKDFEIYAKSKLVYFLIYSILSGILGYWLIFWPMNNYFYNKKKKQKNNN